MLGCAVRDEFEVARTWLGVGGVVSGSIDGCEEGVCFEWHGGRFERDFVLGVGAKCIAVHKNVFVAGPSSFCGYYMGIVRFCDFIDHTYKALLPMIFVIVRGIEGRLFVRRGLSKAGIGEAWFGRCRVFQGD